MFYKQLFESQRDHFKATLRRFFFALHQTLSITYTFSFFSVYLLLHTKFTQKQWPISLTSKRKGPPHHQNNPDKTPRADDQTPSITKNPGKKHQQPTNYKNHTAGNAKPMASSSSVLSPTTLSP